MRFVTYEQFGAKGDGVSDDMPAIIAAHEYANKHDLPVRTKADAHYCIGGKARTTVIMTDTDWGTSRITIDDRALEDRGSVVFRVVSRQPARTLELSTLRRGQKNVGFAPGTDCYVVATENDIRRYIRFGRNQNSGFVQRDNFVLRADGTIEHELLWDFPRVDQALAYPIDETPLILRGGYFTTIANSTVPSQVEDGKTVYNYHQRGIVINRSNTTVVNFHHTVEGEGEVGAPYAGILCLQNCSRVTVRNSFFTSRKIYYGLGSAGLPVPMGSYGINIHSCTDILLKDCTQPAILDTSRWGLVCSQFSKNITVDGCIFSRMDAHEGVYDCTVRRSTLGHQGLNAIGAGTLTVEDCELYGNFLINFREDYGSFWHGDVIVRNTVWHPRQGKTCTPVLFCARNEEQHDFGYDCALPRTVTLENVRVEDTNVPENYTGMFLWNDYNPRFTVETKDTYTAPFPYAPGEKLILRGLTCASGKPWTLCQNPLLKPVAEIAEE